MIGDVVDQGEESVAIVFRFELAQTMLRFWMIARVFYFFRRRIAGLALPNRADIERHVNGVKRRMN